MELWISLAVIAFLLFYFVGLYNKLVAYKNRFMNAFAQIDVQLTRRYELIPNLVTTAKQYMKHESETLEAVIQARDGAQQANANAAKHPDDGQAIEQLAAAETLLSGSLGRLFALSEAYPDLKANQTMTQLMEELTATENKVGFARQAYNDCVMQYNTLGEQFPSNIIAKNFGFKPAQLLEISTHEAKKPVKVAFE